MKLKVLLKDNGAFVPEAYNMSRQCVPLDSIEKGQKVKCIIDLNQIWFIDNKFGISVRLLQVLLEPSKRLPAFAFQLAPPADANSVPQAASEEGSEEEYIDE